MSTLVAKSCTAELLAALCSLSQLTFCLWWTTTRLPSLNKASANSSVHQHTSEEAGNLLEEGYNLLHRLLSPEEGARPLLQSNAYTWISSW
jgi:hypothetical protein